MTTDEKKFDVVVGLLLICAACIGVLAVIGGMDVTAFAYKYTFETIHKSN